MLRRPCSRWIVGYSQIVGSNNADVCALALVVTAAEYWMRTAGFSIFMAPIVRRQLPIRDWRRLILMSIVIADTADVTS